MSFFVTICNSASVTVISLALVKMILKFVVIAIPAEHLGISFFPLIYSLGNEKSGHFLE